MRPIYNRVLSIVGNVITVRASGVAYEELAEVTTERGKSLAQVIKIEDDDLIYLQVFEGSKGVSTEDEIRFLGEPMKVSFSENMLGRTFNGSGEPIDDGPPIDEDTIEIGGPSVNPVKRIVPSKMIRTNIPMIDLYNSLVPVMLRLMSSRTVQPELPHHVDVASPHDDDFARPHAR